MKTISQSNSTSQISKATYTQPKLVSLGTVQKFILEENLFEGVDAALPDTNGSH